MLSKTYKGAMRCERENYLADHWQQIELVVVAGVPLYRRTEPQPKCKRCRHAFGRYSKRCAGFVRDGVGTPYASSVGGARCNVCGNPFVSAERKQEKGLRKPIAIH